MGHGNIPIGLEPSLDMTLEQEMLESVDPEVGEHWDAKVLEGLVPTEVKRRGPVDRIYHEAEVKKLINFEVITAVTLINNVPDLTGKIVHWVGIGEALALKRVAYAANKKGAYLYGYDVSRIACGNGQRALASLGCPENKIFRADIEFVCQKKIILPGESSLLVAARTLGILDKQERNYKQKPKSKRKTARTAKKMGQLLHYIDILLFLPEPSGNEHAVWGDTNEPPDSLDDIASYMSLGLKSPGQVNIQRLDYHLFWGHRYTAGLLSAEFK